jgi:hypothetical protein
MSESTERTWPPPLAYSRRLYLIGKILKDRVNGVVEVNAERLLSEGRGDI